MTDRPTNQPTDGHEGSLGSYLQKIYDKHKTYYVYVIVYTREGERERKKTKKNLLPFLA